MLVSKPTRLPKAHYYDPKAPEGSYLSASVVIRNNSDVEVGDLLVSIPFTQVYTLIVTNKIIGSSNSILNENEYILLPHYIEYFTIHGYHLLDVLMSYNQLYKCFTYAVYPLIYQGKNDILLSSNIIKQARGFNFYANREILLHIKDGYKIGQFSNLFGRKAQYNQ
jgi:hypothetical protein